MSPKIIQAKSHETFRVAKNLIPLVSRHGILNVEREIFRSFAENNDLIVEEIPSFEQYFANHVSINELQDSAFDWRNTSLKELANLFELLIPEQDKKINGAFFTPDYIVDFIVESISPEEQDKNLDLSCGAGIFLIGLVEYYQKHHQKNVSEILRENIFGVDLLPYNIRRAKLLLSLFALMHGQQIRDSDFNLVQANSLQANWDNIFSNYHAINYDNVVGNPPYIKFQDLPSDIRDSFRNKYQTIQGGNFNLYFAFFELGYSLLKHNGRLGFITPNNYFTSLAGESLRRYFQQNQCVHTILDFNHKKVFDAQTYTAITFLTKESNQTILYDRIRDEETTREFLDNLSLSGNKLDDLLPSKWRLLRSDEKENIRNIERAGTPLKHLVDINVGIATLKDEVYFVNASPERDDCYIKSVNGKTYEIEKSITKSIYKISDFKSQADVISNVRKIIFPYLVHGRRAELMSEDYLSKHFPKSYLYLSDMRELLSSRNKGKLTLEAWYGYGRTQGLTKKGVKLLTPTFSQQPRFLLVNESDALFCNGYGIFLKKRNERDLFDSNLIAQEGNLDVLQKILNSSLMDYYVKKTSVSIEGGYPCYQKNFIEKFSIPRFGELEIKTMKELTSLDDINNFLSDLYDVRIR